MDCSRASRELGWTPTVDALTVLGEIVTGMQEGSADETPVLRARSVAGQMAAMLRRGPVAYRRQP
jgi:hypothetical protein